MSDQADLEKKTIEALRHYRKALARVESQEEAEASARRELTGMLPDLERAILEDCAPSVKDNLVQTGLAAVSRSNEVLIPEQAAHRFRDDAAHLFRLIAARHSD